jgi:hypothetical protein
MIVKQSIANEPSLGMCHSVAIFAVPLPGQVNTFKLLIEQELAQECFHPQAPKHENRPL